MVRQPRKPRPPRPPRGTKNRPCDKIGFESYKSYLQSELWASIRLRVLERDHYICQCCGRRACQVHHFIYSTKVIQGVDDLSLVSLCEPCHHFGEFSKNGRKRGHTAANHHIFNAMCRFHSPRCEAIRQVMKYESHTADNLSYEEEKRAQRKRRLERDIANEKHVWQRREQQWGAGSPNPPACYAPEHRTVDLATELPMVHETDAR